jgi:hypothetical protein
MAVYGDVLAASGAAQGTLVQLQLALEARPGDPRLVAAEARHLATFARELLGAASMHTSLFRLEWSRGFVVRAAVRSLAQEAVDGFRPEVRRSRLAKATRELLRAPVCVELTQLALEMPWSAIAVAHLLAAVREVREGAPATLTRLEVRTLQRWEDEWGIPAGPWDEGPLVGAGSLTVRSGRRLEVFADPAVAPRLARLR